MEALHAQSGAAGRLIVEKFPSNQRNFPNPSSCCGSTESAELHSSGQLREHKHFGDFPDALFRFSVKNFLTAAEK